MKRLLALNLILLLFLSALYAVIPAGYYNSLEGKKAAQLKTELNKIICKDTTHYLGYGSGKGKTWEGFNYTDQDPVTHAVIDMYSANVRYFPYPNPNFVAFGQTIHIEHSMPKSWWACDIDHADVAAKDLHHLYPADGPTNSSKNDNPLGVVTGTVSLNNGVSKVGKAVYDGYSGSVFEPADQYKGDFARSYLYMAAAYEHYVNRWDISKPENMMEKNTYPTFKPWAIKLLLEWHKNDPVSQKELTRTEVVYGIQTNRNPFIDHPELADYIWGDKTMIPYRLDGRTDFPYLAFPTTDDLLDFGQAYIMQTSNSAVTIKAANLTGDLSLTIGGQDAANFSLDKYSLTKSEAEAGYNVGVRFFSSTVGLSNATLTITGGGITPVVVSLKAFISSSFAALPATNITDNSFTANWTAASGATSYLLDVYTFRNNPPFTSTKLVEEDFIGLMPNSWTKSGYTDNSWYSNIRLGSATLEGRLTLPSIDLSSNAAKITVKAKQYSSDNGALLYLSVNNLPFTSWVTGVSAQSFTAIIPKGSASTSLSLSSNAANRTYVDYVKVETYQPAQVAVSISGFPKTVNDLNYQVTGIAKDTVYYYTVTPNGTSLPASNQIQTRDLQTNIDATMLSIISYSKLTDGICLKNLPVNASLTLYDAVGRRLKAQKTESSSTILQLQQQGVYLLQLHVGKSSKSFKVVF